MTDITETKYRQQILAIAEDLATEALQDNEWNREAALESINDTRLHETIDGHQWVIYTAYNLDVLKFSGNADAYIDNFGTDDAGSVIKERGINGLHAVMAFCAMEQDVRDVLDDAVDAAIEKRDTETA